MSSRFANLPAVIIVLCLQPVVCQAQGVTPIQLVDYYSKLPGQYIKPDVEQINKSSQTVFILNDDDAYTPVGENQFNVEFTQDLFKTDVKQFISSMNAYNFLDAKVKFYSKLGFDHRWQKHETPYHYMQGWLSLNHPPVKKIEFPLGTYSKIFSETNPRPETSTYFSPDFQNKIDEETGTELTFGNKAKALFNGEAIKEKIRLVNDAKRYVFGSVMATVCDSSSEEFVQALISKAQSGVPVTIMMESFYMKVLFRRCMNRLRAGGVDVLMINEKWKPKTFLTFFHAKFWIRDGEEVVVGGQNIVEYENSSTGYNQLNRDTDLLIQGPVTTDFLEEYLKLWESHARKRNMSLDAYKDEVIQTKTAQRIAHARGKQFYIEKLGNPATRMQGTCRALVQGPRNSNLSIAQVLRHYVEASKHSVLLTSPEIDFDGKNAKYNQLNALFQSTRDAVARGVDVELILNGVDGGNGEFTAFIRKQMIKAYHNGKGLLHKFWGNMLNHEPQNTARKHREFLRDLQMTRGYRTWTHFNYMHAKQGYFDRIATSISSMNLDQPSTYGNYEAGAICLDEDLSRQMENQFTLDLVNSAPVVSSNEDQSFEDQETALIEEMEQSSPDQE